MSENNIENKVVAKIDDVEITQSDVFRFLNEIDPQVASQFNTPEGVQKVIEELVNQELLYLDAKENNLEEEQGYKDLLEDNKKALLKSYALNKVISDVNPTEEELKEYYEEHKDQFKTEETRVASHILVETKEEAEEALKAIDNGLTFEEAASKYSTCPSKQQGGNLGEFGRGKMIPEFENHAFAMEEGTISEPVRSQFGYHVIRLEEKNEEKVKSFDEAKEEVKTQLTRIKQQEKYLNKIEELENKHNVERP